MGQVIWIAEWRHAHMDAQPDVRELRLEYGEVWKFYCQLWLAVWGIK